MEHPDVRDLDERLLCDEFYYLGLAHVVKYDPELWEQMIRAGKLRLNGSEPTPEIYLELCRIGAARGGAKNGG